MKQKIKKVSIPDNAIISPLLKFTWFCHKFLGGAITMKVLLKFKNAPMFYTKELGLLKKGNSFKEAFNL